MFSKLIKKQKRAHEYYDSGDEDENVDESKTQNDADDQKTNTPPEIQWTREEDRLLLEQMKAGLDPNVENITGFVARFPNKTQNPPKSNTKSH